LGFGIWDLGFGIWDLGFGIWDLGSGIWDLGFGIWDLGFGSYFRVNRHSQVRKGGLPPLFLPDQAFAVIKADLSGGAWEEQMVASRISAKLRNQYTVLAPLGAKCW
jgi:hypothetical protein